MLSFLQSNLGQMEPSWPDDQDRNDVWVSWGKSSNQNREFF